MNMLGHDYITDGLEAVPRANLIEYLYEAVPGPSSTEQGTPPIATDSNEVEIAAPIETLRTIAHKQAPTARQSQRPHP